MKGRAIVLEEYERMIDAVDKVILKPNTSFSNRERKPDNDRIPSWKFFLEGLWLSGLRLGEAIDLHWSNPDCICVDVSGRHPVLQIPADKEKGSQDRTLPVTPDFGRFLLSVPKQHRSGFVFNPMPQNAGASRMLPNAVGRKVSAIGKVAGVITNTKGGKTRYATAHDFRRAFGTRWSRKVMPVVLKELMRHHDLNTTLRFYISANAAKTAADLWEQENHQLMVETA